MKVGRQCTLLVSHLFVSVVPLLIAQIQRDVRALPYIGYFPAACVQYVSKPAQHIKDKGAFAQVLSHESKLKYDKLSFCIDAS